MDKQMISKEETQAYLDIFINTLFELVPETDVFNIRTIQDGHKPNDQFHTKQELLEIAHQYRSLNSKGGQILIGVNPRSPDNKYPTKSKDVKYCPCLFADFDDVGDLTWKDLHKAILDKKLPVPTLTINSGHGFHVYWKLNELLPPKEWTSFQKRLNHNIRYADEKIKDPSRLMRLPGFMNTKKRLLVECIIIDVNNKSYDISKFDEVLPELPQIKTEEREIVIFENMNYPATLEKAENYCAKFEKINDGRKTTAYQLGCVLLHDFQLQMADAMDIAKEWNKKQGNYFTEKDLQKQIVDGGLYANGPKGSLAVEKRKPNVGVEFWDEVIAKQYDVEWLWENRFPIGFVTSLIGLKHHGKSLVTEFLAYMLSLPKGNPMWPDNIRRHFYDEITLIINTEDNRYAVSSKRLQQLGAAGNICWMKIEADKDGKKEQFKLREIAKIKKMLEDIKEEKGKYPKLIIIDHINLYLGKTAKHQGAQTQVIAPLNNLAEEYKCAIIALNHRRQSTEGPSENWDLGTSELKMSIKGGIWMVVWDKETNWRYFMFNGSNLAVEPTNLRFKVEGHWKNGTYRIVWDDEPVTGKIEDVCRIHSDEEEEHKKTYEHAEEYLRNMLTGVEMESSKVLIEMNKRGFKRNMVYKAASELKIVRDYEGRRDNLKSYWSLPNTNV